ncbi:MAG: ABC transporter substrate-binding protein, partial [Deltaproteobacteria bacterium]|nr:ABC transporter substrate-binding protein [Deltaproteobacteria bacterium]
LFLMLVSPAQAVATGEYLLAPLTSKDKAPMALRIGINAADIETLDPHLAASFQDRMVADMVFNGLLRYAPGNAPHFEPDLAEDIPEPFIVDGRQIWTFKLKRGVYFHAGPNNAAYEFSADDVIYSLRKAADPKRSAYAGEYAGMSFEKVDDFTCNIILETPLSPNLFFPKVADYAGGFIVSARALQPLGDSVFSTHPVGTGPFSFISRSPKRQLLLAAHSGYFRNPPHISQVLIRFLPDPIERYTAFSRRELDLIRAETEPWQREPFPADTLIDTFGVPEVALIHFNTSIKPLDDLRVRKAIAYALDRDGFLARFPQATVGNVYAPIPQKFLPGGLSLHEIKALGLDYQTNLVKSRALLTEAGYPDGLTLDLVATKLRHVRKNYETLQAQLARVGIKINLKIVDHFQMHRLIRKDLSPIVIYEAWRPNTDVFLSRFFHSDSIVISGKNPDTNFSHYQDIDTLILLAREEMNPLKQEKLWEYAQIKLLEDMIVYPLHYRNRVYIRHGYVDYGHTLNASMALYPQITEKTRLLK